MREIKFRAWNDAKVVPVDAVASGGAWTESVRGDVWSNGGLMQYTGLEDKNGVEIYEGDIVVIRQQGAQQKPRRVLYAEDVAAYAMSHHASGKPSVGIGGYYLEVIGNIYENPELLEAKS